MKGKTLLCLAVVTSMLLGVFMIGPVSAPSTTLGVEPSSIIDHSLEPDKTFKVEIWVRNVVDLYGFEFKLGYDTTVLTATLIEYGGIFGDKYFPWISKIYDDQGYLHYGAAENMLEPTFTGSARAANITFKVDSFGGSHLHLYDTILVEGTTGGDIVHDALDGYFVNVMWLHAEGGLIDLSNPVGTDWHELCPAYSNTYNVTSLEDRDSSGNVSHCDNIKLMNKTSEVERWYGVEKVTVTLNVTYGDEVTSTNSPSSTSGTWTNGQNAYADDGAFASVLSGEPSASQYYSAYGFNIPTDALIVQVRVRLDAQTEQFLWISGNDDFVRRVTTADPATVDTYNWDTGQSRPYGVEWYDGYVYYVDYGTDYIYNKTEAGTPIANWDIGAFSGDPYGLGCNGTHFAIADAVDDKIYITSMTAPGTKTQEFTCDADTEGVCWKDGYWYATSSGTDRVAKYSPGGVQSTTYSLNTSIAASSGITWDGKYWWIGDSGTDLVYKLTQSDLEGGTYTASYDTPNADEQGLSIELVPDAEEYICLKVSNDSGSTWLTSEWNTTLTGPESTYWVDVTGWTDWTPANINSNNIRTQVWAYTNGTEANIVYLDWIPIEVTYITYLDTYMYIEFEGNIQDLTWTNPVSTQWHEIYPVFNRYNLTFWEDYDDSGNLTLYDYIRMENKTSEVVDWYHVEGISTDIIVTELTHPIPEFPLETVLPIALIVAVVYVWWINKRKRIRRQQKPTTSTISHCH